MAASGVTLWYRNVSIAYFVLPIQHVPEDKERGDVIEIEATTVASVDSDGFARLVTHFMQESVVNVSVSATIAANVTTVVGPLSLHDIPLSQALVLNGVGVSATFKLLDLTCLVEVQRVPCKSGSRRVFTIPPHCLQPSAPSPLISSMTVGAWARCVELLSSACCISLTPR